MVDVADNLLTKTPLWLSLVGKAAPLSSVALYMAPMPTVVAFSRQKLIGDLPLLPYTSMMSNALTWLVYGVLNSEPKLWTCQGVGMALSFFYFLSYARYTPKGASTLPGTLDQHVQGFVVILALVSWFAKSKKAGAIGMVGLLINIVMLASPLSAIQTVLATKSSKSIPLPVTLASLVGSILWSFTGYLDMKDPYIWAPSFFGILSGLVQVALKLIFAEKEGEAAPLLSPDLDSNEMASDALAGMDQANDSTEQLLAPPAATTNE